MIENIKVESWEQFQEEVAGTRFRRWAFRGHSDARWSLFSSLSRYFRTYGVDPRAWAQQESRILRIFQRKSHLFLDHIPQEGDSFQWLALMQHHGAPTRLLDFTWSPYVSAFFALEKATDDAAIWALFPPGLNTRMIRTLRASQKIEEGEIGPWVPGNYEKYFLENTSEIVIIGEPDRMNRRLVAQSGTFVMPGVLNIPIEALVPEDAVVKFTLSTAKFRKRAMEELYAMNISNATLFPDLDGLARSLAFELEFHWAYDPVTMERFEGFSIE
jgi:hypothetical protein